MVKAVDRAHAIGAMALQIFGDNPTAWRRRAAPLKEQPAFRARLHELDIGPVAIHAAYLVNLAGWQADFYERSIGVLAHDVAGAPGFGARFVNVHAGSHRGAGPAAGAAQIADGIARVLAEADHGSDTPMLVIENSAGGGDSMGSTVEALADMAGAIAARGVEREQVGFCVDAAHAWGAGYRISVPDEVDALVERFDQLIGVDRLVMVHLNDTRSGLGSRTDQHEHVGAGQIGPDGLRRLLTHPSLAATTFYLETPGMDEGYDAVNVARALDLAAGRPLEALPPEAFELSRDRARAAPAPDEQVADDDGDETQANGAGSAAESTGTALEAAEGQPSAPRRRTVTSRA
jgi:deoxyribonuclease-4